MTTVETRTDTKAGYSTDCRADRHRLCEMSQARCTCSCHGPNGQQPPTPKEAAMSEATVTPLHAKPTPVEPRTYKCEDCGQTFQSPASLGGHRKVHNPQHVPRAKPERKPKAPKAKAEPRKAPTGPKDADDRQLLAIVAQAYHDLNGADIATSIDSAATILDAIRNADWRIVEAS